MVPTAVNKDSSLPLVAPGSQPLRLLDPLRQMAVDRGHSASTAAIYVEWSRRYILFHGKRHPRELGRWQIVQFLEQVARTQSEPLVAIALARAALEFLYGDLLRHDLGALPWVRPPRLLDQVRQVMRVRHYSPRTEECYVQWIARYIRFHGLRHPRDMTAAEVQPFLTHLAVAGRVSASTQNQALNALVFLYQQVLEIDLGRFDAVRARRPKRLPVVLSPEEVQKVLEKIQGGSGLFQLMARLLYGCGLRLQECCQLRVKDVLWDRNQIVVRGGKGDKDRIVMLPRSVRADLEQQRKARHALQERDVVRGVAQVDLPNALERKYPAAAREWGWQFLFGSRQLSRCPRTGRTGRHHVFPASVQRAVALAGIAAGLEKRIHCHTYRHSFATHLVERGVDIRSVQLLLGHESLETTMVYTRVARKGVSGITSPLDVLADANQQSIGAAIDGTLRLRTAHFEAATPCDAREPRGLDAMTWSNSRWQQGEGPTVVGMT